MTRRAAWGAGLAITLVALSLGGRPLAWWLTLGLLRLGFPGTATVTPDALTRALASSTPPVVFDARRAAEFAVSHLPGARLVDVEAGAVIPSPPTPGTAAVVYCSVGYRSSRLARDLERRGWADVRSLEGGIFGWAIAGLPLVDATELSTSLVHSYGWPARLLLPPPLRGD